MLRSAARQHLPLGTTSAGPRSKKGAARRPNYVWVDEAAFYLLAGVVRTYASWGQTPVLRALLTRDHLSLISGITEAGRLQVRMQDHAFDGAAIVGFLRQVLRGWDRSLIVIWDDAPIHRDQQVKEFLGANVGAVHLELLPGYAPDLNLDAAVWQQLKQVELANVVCQDQDKLRCQWRRTIARLRRRPDIIRDFIEHYGY